MKKINAAYLRVSTEAQTEKYGLDMQRQKILEYCDKNSIIVDRWYVDGGYSGSKLDRPEMQRLLLDAQNGEIEKVLVYKLDRLSRDTADTLNLLNKTLPKYGVQIVSMTEDLKFENPMDKVMIGVNAIMGQYEREVIYMRTRAGMKERVKKGLWMGGGMVPYGYRYDRNDGILHPVEEEAEKVREAYRLYIDGYSCEKISKMLGFKGERIVIQILKRKLNIGLIEYKGEVYQGKHDAIVDEKTFYVAQECMKKRHTNSHINNENLLTGLCYCGVCGARMRYQKWGKYHKLVCYSQYKSGKDYMKRNPDCGNKKVMASDIEDIVVSRFKKFIINIEKNETRKSNADLLENEIDKSNSKIKKLYNIYLENESDNVMELIKEEEDRAKDLKIQLELEKEKERKIDNSQLRNIRNKCDAWNEFTNQEKNKILKMCVDKIIIKRDDIEVYFVSF